MIPVAPKLLPIAGVCTPIDARARTAPMAAVPAPPVQRSTLVLLDGATGNPHGPNALPSVTAQHVQRAVERIDRFLRTTLDWNGWDGAGSPLTVVLNAQGPHRSPLHDAYWDSTTKRVLLGNSADRELLQDPGLLAHEIMHGVIDTRLAQAGRRTDTDSPLSTLFAQPIKESWADVLASAAIGKVTLGVVAGRAPVRDLARPAIRHVTQLERLSGAGIHDLSGPASLAAVHAARTLGLDKVAQIWFRALDTLDPTQSYRGARDATVRAARHYGHGSVEHRAVDAAWTQVGVS